MEFYSADIEIFTFGWNTLHIISVFFAFRLSLSFVYFLLIYGAFFVFFARSFVFFFSNSLGYDQYKNELEDLLPPGLFCGGNCRVEKRINVSSRKYIIMVTF
jgi:hypothetical protein